MGIESQLEKLADLMKGSNDKAPNEISRAANIVMLTSGVSTIQRTIRLPRVDGIKMRGIWAMLGRVLKQNGYNSILVASDIAVLTTPHGIVGHIFITRAIRTYELLCVTTRELQAVLLRDRQIRSLIKQDRRPTMARAFVDMRSNSINAKILAMGKADHPSNWELAYPSLVDHTGMRKNMEANPKTYWKKWSESSSNLTLLLGDPGTGKSSWMRGLMDARGYRGTAPIVIDSTDILDHPGINAFLSSISDGSLVLIEDADLFLGKRDNGNSKMAGLLNAISGIANLRFKICISTNLPTLRTVDAAVYRPGRGFQVLEFKKMNREQALMARAAYRDMEPIDLPEGDYTLAEALNYGNIVGNDFKTGFVQ